MESNGKGVIENGDSLEHDAGCVIFGEPGTLGQHSFHQLLHQGRVIPTEFIGYFKTQCTVKRPEILANHDELISNLFS